MEIGRGSSAYPIHGQSTPRPMAAIPGWQSPLPGKGKGAEACAPACPRLPCYSRPDKVGPRGKGAEHVFPDLGVGGVGQGCCGWRANAQEERADPDCEQGAPS